jgi:hypothetical protein
MAPLADLRVSKQKGGTLSSTLPGAKRLFLPINTGRGAVGIVGIDSDKPGPLRHPSRFAKGGGGGSVGALVS